MSGSQLRGSKKGKKKPEMSRVERKRLARKEKMLEIALSIIESDGVESLTIKRIADEMDLVMGAIYRYYRSKAALLSALQVRALEALQMRFKEDLEGLRAYVEEVEQTDAVVGAMQVLSVAHTYFTFNHLHPAYHRLLDTLLSSPKLYFVSKDDVDEEEDSVSAPEGVSQNEEILLALLDGAARSIAMSLGDDVERELCMQHAHVLWASLHGLNHFRKRDNRLPVYLKSQSLKPLAVRSLLLGWGVSKDVLDVAWDLFATYIEGLPTLQA
jgi:AcrR family transcriptional regulator